MVPANKIELPILHLQNPRYVHYEKYFMAKRYVPLVKILQLPEVKINDANTVLVCLYAATLTSGHPSYVTTVSSKHDLHEHI